MERKTSLQHLDLVRDMILQSIAERYQKNIEHALQDNQERYTQTLLNTAVAVQESVTNQLHQNQNLTPSELQRIVADHKENSQISTYQADFINEVVSQSKDQLLMSQKLEMAYKATKEFIEQHEQGFSKQEINEMLKDQFITNDLTKDQKKLFEATVENALENIYGKNTLQQQNVNTGISSNQLSFGQLMDLATKPPGTTKPKQKDNRGFLNNAEVKSQPRIRKS